MTHHCVVHLMDVELCCHTKPVWPTSPPVYAAVVYYSSSQSVFYLTVEGRRLSGPRHGCERGSL